MVHRRGLTAVSPAVALLAAVSACTEPEPPAPAAPEADAGRGGEADAALPGPPDGFSVAAPAPPEAPRFPPPQCPDGWLAAHELPEGAPADGPCVPPPRVACEGASAQFTGDAACRRIGTACPEGDDFLDEAALRALAPGYDGTIRYVSPQGRGAACSRDAPCRSVSDALRRPPGDGTILALAAGTYPIGPLDLDGVALVELACVYYEETAA